MSWADSEFQDALFGDDRLRQRAIRVCERLADSDWDRATHTNGA